MDGWRKTTLGEVCDEVEGIIQTGPFGSQLHESDYSPEGIPVVMPKDIIEGRIATDSIARVSPKHVERLSRHKLRSGDIVYGRRGDIGRQALIRPEQEGWMCGTGCLRLSFGESLLNPLFLHYYLRQEDVVSWITNQAVGATMPNLNTGILRTVPVRFPPLPEQQRIAGILSTYDELIENSQRRIKILESMARALYCDCVREAGASAPAKSILDVDYWKFISTNVLPYEGTKRYYATADIEKLTIEGVGLDYVFAEKPSRAQKQPTPFSVWFARMKDTYKIAWYSDVNSYLADSSMLSSGFAGFQATEPLYFPLLFLTVSSKEFHVQKDLFCTGATQMSLTNEGLSRIEVPVLRETKARWLGEQVLPLLNQMLIFQIRNQNLRRTRDLLLPRLLSGKVALETEAA